MISRPPVEASRNECHVAEKDGYFVHVAVVSRNFISVQNAVDFQPLLLSRFSFALVLSSIFQKTYPLRFHKRNTQKDGRWMDIWRYKYRRKHQSIFNENHVFWIQLKDINV